MAGAALNCTAESEAGEHTLHFPRLMHHEIHLKVLMSVLALKEDENGCHGLGSAFVSGLGSWHCLLR